MGGIVDSIFGGGGGKAYKDLQRYVGMGMDERRQGEQRAEEALSPYTGNPRIQNLFEQALSRQSNPAEFYNSLMGSYQQSPFAKYQTEAGMNAIQHALSASGMHGSGDELRALQENAQDISSQDQQRYLNSLLGINSDYMGRLGGLESQESEHGYGARGQLGGWRYGLGNQLAQDYQAQGQAKANEDISNASGWQNLLGVAGRGLIGGLTGGPLGALGGIFGGGGRR